MSCQPTGDVCLFVHNHSDACGGGGWADYSAWVWCADGAGRAGAVVGCVALLLVLFVALSVAAESFFCPCLKTMTEVLGMSENIAGVTLLAFGNGAPDIFSSLASVTGTTTPKPGLAIGALLGSGVFLTTVVNAIITLIGPFDVMRRPLIRDLLFYIVAVAATLFIILKGEISLAETASFLALYAIYVVVVVLGRWVRMRNQRLHQRFRDDGEDAADSPPHPSDRGQLPREDSILEEAFWRVPHHPAPRDLPSIPERTSGVEEEEEGPLPSLLCQYTRDLAASLRPCEAWASRGRVGRCVSVLTAPVELVLRATIPVVDVDTRAALGGWAKALTMLQALIAPTLTLLVTKQWRRTAGPVPSLAISAVVGVLLSAAVGLVTSRSQPPRFHRLLSFGGFLMAVLWIYALAREVVGIVTMIGSLVKVSEDLLGLTVLAWSNSLGDLISDISVARAGYSRMALSACIGGPLFNLLVGVGLSFTVATTMGAGSTLSFPFKGVRLVLASFLALSLLSSLVLLPTARFRATRLYAVYLLVLYAAFLTVVALTEFDVIPFGHFHVL